MIFKEQPKDFKSKFEIVSCFIEVDGEILLLHRQDHKPQGNTWGAPAGKKDAHESLEEAIKREVLEETTLKLENVRLSYFDKVFVRYPDFDFIYHIFHYALDIKPTIVINSSEHKGFVWIGPKEALKIDLIQDEDACIKLFYKIS